MQTRKFTVTHVSLVGFDGSSHLWRAFLNENQYSYHSFQGDLWHVAFPQCDREVTIEVTSDFVLGGPATIKYWGVYSGSINVGLNQQVLAMNVYGREPHRVFENMVKLYTTEPTTKEFLSGKPLFVASRESCESSQPVS